MFEISRVDCVHIFQADCQYVLEVEKFKLWDLQEGFSRKADDLQFW